MNSDELKALAERVMALTGPDKEVDAEIGKRLGFACKPKNIYKKNCYPLVLARVVEVWPAFTASLDAAMTLVPEGWGVLLAFGPSGAVCDLSTEGLGGNGIWPAHARAATPALALTAAALLARAEVQYDAG